MTICYPPTLGHVTLRMRIAQKRFIMGFISKLPLIVTADPESCKVNRHYAVGDPKCMVVFDPPTLGHVTRRMRIAPKHFIMGGLSVNYP